MADVVRLPAGPSADDYACYLSGRVALSLRSLVQMCHMDLPLFGGLASRFACIVYCQHVDAGAQFFGHCFRLLHVAVGAPLQCSLASAASAWTDFGPPVLHMLAARHPTDSLSSTKIVVLGPALRR